MKSEDWRTALSVRGHGSVPLSHSGNVVTRTGLQQQQLLTILIVKAWWFKFIKQDPGLQSFFQVKVPLTLREVILRRDN